MPILEPQVASFPFVGGLNTAAEQKLIEAPQLADVVNGVYRKQGAIRKRYGFDLFDGPGTGAEEVFAYDDSKQLLAQADNALHIYVPSQDDWASRGNLASASTDVRPLQRSYGDHRFSDCALYNDDAFIVTVWEILENDVSYIEYKVTDRETGVTYQGPTRLGQGRAPLAVATSLGPSLWYISGGNNLVRYQMEPINPIEPGTSYTVATGLSSGRVLDVVVASDVIYAAWEDGTSSTIYVGKSSGITFSGTVDTTAAGDRAVAIDASESTFLTVVSVDADRLTRAVSVVKASLAVSSVAVSVTTLTDPPLGIAVDSGVAYVNCQNSTSDLRSVWHYAVTTAVTPTASIDAAPSLLRYHVNLASKVSDSGTLILQTVMTDLTQNTHYLGTLSTDGAASDLLRARFNVGTAAAHDTAGPLPHVNTMDSTVLIAVRKQTELRADDDAQVYTVAGTDLVTFTPVARYPFAEMDSTAYLGGGILMAFDGGDSLVEHGFLAAPHIYSATAGGSGGGQATGAYQYQAIYEWRNNRGERVASAPSAIVSVDVTSGEEVTLVISTLPLTFRTGTRQDVTIVVYRTAADSEGPFYRVSGTTVTTGDNALLINDTEEATVTMVDSLVDSSILGREFPYTDGGVLENDCPPGLAALTVAGNRLWGVGQDDRSLLWPSKTYQATIGAEFSELLTLRVSDNFGPITALAPMDDKLVVFKERAIYVVTGEGPNLQGAGAPFTVTQLASSVGCISPASVVSTDLGVLFKSAKGIYLLNRGLSVEYVGAPVKDYDSETVTSACLLPDVNEVRFTTSDSRTLVYNFEFGLWSTFDNHESPSACVWDGAWTTIRADDGKLRTETTSFSDGGSFYPLELTTAWFKFGGIEGYQRVWRAMILGTWKNSEHHVLNVEAGYDFADEFFETVGFDTETGLATDGYGEGGYGEGEYGGAERDATYQWRVDLGRTLCTSVRFRLSDVSETPQENCEIVALSLEYGVLPRGHRFAEKKQAGAS